MRWLPDATLRHLAEVVAEPDLAATPYRLVGPLARGGMATVYEAEDRRLGRRVALKVLHTPDAGGTVAQRLRREAQIIARLEHPGIVPVHDVGTLPDGRVFYAMKRVEGARLDVHLGREASLAGRLRLFQRVCEAVAFAHSHGVIHRDLKPENVMVGAFGEVLVMDWGLAKHLREAEPPAGPAAVEGHDRGSAGPPAATTTSHGTVLGTPGFMAPEQERGTLSEVDERADVYSLGVMLFLLLTGRLPSGAAPAEAPPHPRQLDRTVPKGIDAVCAKCLAPRPAERFRDAGEVVAELNRFLDGRPVLTYRENLLDTLRRWGSRYRTAIVLVATYLVVRILILVLLGR